MSFGEFLIPILGDSNDADFLDNVSKFAQGLEVSKTLFFCYPDPKDMLMISADGFVAGVGASIVESIEKSNDKAWDKVQNTAKQYPEFALERAMGSVDTLLPERAVISDLIVVSGKCAAGKCNLSAGFDETLLQARIPSLIIKNNARLSYENIAIAWDGSAQAGRAVKAAMPMLKLAKYITILQIGGEAEVTNSVIHQPVKLQEALKKHDINADVLVQEHSGKGIGDTILSLCEKIGVDVLVSGAYGHSRAREFVFGGTSRTLLRAENGPNLIVCH